MSELKLPTKPLGENLETLRGTYRSIPAEKTRRDLTKSDLWRLVGGDLKDLQHGTDTVTIDPVSGRRLKFTLAHHGVPAKSFTRRLSRRGDWLDLGCQPTGESNVMLSTTGKECAVMGMTADGRLCIVKRWQGIAWWLYMPIAANLSGDTVTAYYRRVDPSR